MQQAERHWQRNVLKLLPALGAAAIFSIPMGGGKTAEEFARSACRDCPLALWSAELRFPHPVTGEPLFRTLPPPVQWPWTLFSPEEQA